MPEMKPRGFGFPMPKAEPLRPVPPVGRSDGPVPSWAPGLSPNLRMEDFAIWSRPSKSAPPPERRDGLDIFVGGLGDDLPVPWLGVTRDYARTYKRETGRPTRCFPNARVKDVVAAIREGNATGGPVNVVGHSYGGPDAYNASVLARSQGLRVDNLVTLDPVTAFYAGAKKGKPAESWTNVKAVSKSPNGSDKITNIPLFSENPSRLHTRSADRQVNVGAHHENVDGMMRRSGARGVLDASRQLKPALSDKQPINDWMTTRAAGAGR